jgi:hypothetical protein
MPVHLVDLAGYAGYRTIMMQRNSIPDRPGTEQHDHNYKDENKHPLRHSNDAGAKGSTGFNHGLHQPLSTL